MLLLNNYPFEVPEEHTPGLEQRVDSARSIAHLKDTNGEVSYDAWSKSGLWNGWNASLEFLKAYIVKPARNTKKDFPGKTDAEIIAACLDKAKTTEYKLNDETKLWEVESLGEADLFWKDYQEKKALKNPSAPKSESNTTVETTKESG